MQNAEYPNLHQLNLQHPGQYTPKREEPNKACQQDRSTQPVSMTGQHCAAYGTVTWHCYMAQWQGV